MQGQVDGARAFLESEQGKDFEKEMQESFLAGNPSSQTDWADKIMGQRDQQKDLGNAGQGEDSTSGMNSAPDSRLGDNAEEQDTTTEGAYNDAGREQQADDGPYTGADTTSSGGYGVNAEGSSFSAENQSGMGNNSTGQFGN